MRPARRPASSISIPDDAINPYLPAAARGPWIVTLKGAVLHDNGGYGMLGFGHNPPAIIDAMSRPQVMANVMTAERVAAALERGAATGKSAAAAAAARTRASCA